MSHVNDRLAALEAGLRRSRIINRLLGVALVGMFTIAATTGGYTAGMDARFGTIWAKRVVVANEAGKTLAIMTCGENGGMVGIANLAGKTLASMACSENGGSVSVHNPAGKLQASMTCDEYGNGSVGAFDRKGLGRTLTPGP